MYNLFTQWLTLSVIFFLMDYAFNFIQVVTLGGLVAGSFMLGVWTTFAERLARKLPSFIGKAVVCAAVLLGVEGLCVVLPGYELEVSAGLVMFLVIYSALAIYIGRFLDSEV